MLTQLASPIALLAPLYLCERRRQQIRIVITTPLRLADYTTGQLITGARVHFSPSNALNNRLSQCYHFTLMTKSLPLSNRPKPHPPPPPLCRRRAINTHTHTHDVSRVCDVPPPPPQSSIASTGRLANRHPRGMPPVCASSPKYYRIRGKTHAPSRLVSSLLFSSLLFSSHLSSARETLPPNRQPPNQQTTKPTNQQTNKPTHQQTNNQRLHLSGEGRFARKG